MKGAQERTESRNCNVLLCANCGWIVLSNVFAFVQSDSFSPGPKVAHKLNITNEWKARETNVKSAHIEVEAFREMGPSVFFLMMNRHGLLGSKAVGEQPAETPKMTWR